MDDTVSGSVPSDLVRPLALPTVAPGHRCPVTRGSRVVSPYFGGIALGSGDVRPIIGAVGGNIRGGIVWMYHPHGYPGWWSVKTLWYATPSYTGPILIRGQRLDGAGKIAFGEVPSVFAPQLSPDATLNGGNGWREYPGGTFVRNLGCYGFQIDGSSFSTVIVFKATRSRA